MKIIVKHNLETVFSDVEDICEVLEITVWDENKHTKADFLGKVLIPLLQVESDEKKWYKLKGKSLFHKARGSNPEILVEVKVVWNRYI